MRYGSPTLQPAIVLREVPQDLLDPGVDILLLRKSHEVDVNEEGEGTPGVLYQRTSGVSSCNSMLGTRLQSLNTPTPFASIAALIPADERSWLIALMVATLLVF
jgi:hypothetical protein